MKQRALLICAVSAVSALSAFTAQGQSLEVKLISINPSLTVSGTFNNGSAHGYLSGVNNFTTTSFSSDNFDFDAFCVQPSSYISIGQTLTYEVTDTSHLRNSDKVARLVTAFLGSSQTSADAAAIQWAIWEVTADTALSTDLGSGNVRIFNSSSGTRSLGNQYLADIDTYGKAEIYYLTNSKHQDMIAYKPHDGVPEPATFGLVALSSVLLLRRKRG